MNRNSSGLKGIGDKNKKVKGNRSPFSCKRRSPISQSGLEFKLRLLLSRWQGHGRDRRVSQGCSSTTRMSQVQGHKCYPFKICCRKIQIWPFLTRFSSNFTIFYLRFWSNFQFLLSVVQWSQKDVWYKILNIFVVFFPPIPSQTVSPPAPVSRHLPRCYPVVSIANWQTSLPLRFQTNLYWQIVIERSSQTAGASRCFSVISVSSQAWIGIE